MTALERLIRAEIEASGPIGLDRYMALALGHPEHGYYRTRDPLGAAGDFITAPEISQVFGEVIGVWCAAVWAAMGRPTSIVLAELGPGRGTLMADALRAARVMPGFADALEVHLVETSPALRAAQASRLKAATWHETIDSLPTGPAIVIANEFFDALPIRQFERHPDGLRERRVGLVDGRLGLGVSPALVDNSDFPVHLLSLVDGAIVETCRPAVGLVSRLARRRDPLVLLAIDYAHGGDGIGDTFQALRHHKPVDPFADTGEADLTAHVDFRALAGAAEAEGLAALRLSQRAFLTGLGAIERTERLARLNPESAETLVAATKRLIDPAPTGMGTLFQAFAMTRPDIILPVFSVS